MRTVQGYTPSLQGMDRFGSGCSLILHVRLSPSRPRAPVSLRLDVRVADDLTPLRALGAHERGELLGRVADDFGAGVEHLFLYVGRVVGLDDFAVEDLQ